MSDTDSLSGISFYLDDSIFALASPATHARSTLSTTVSNLSLPLSSPYLLPILPSSWYPTSFTTIRTLIHSDPTPPLAHPPSFTHDLILALARPNPFPTCFFLPLSNSPPKALLSPCVSLYLLHALISRSLSTKYAIYPRASHHRTRSRHD